MKDFNNYKNETFKELPELVVGCNFEDCVFEAATKFERCNLTRCKFEKKVTFFLSNVTDGDMAEECVFDKSNNIDSAEEERMRKEMEEALKEDK